jgi:hypothetical protein
MLRLTLATLTFVVFFYSTALLTSYFYPLDWAPSHSNQLARELEKMDKK